MSVRTCGRGSAPYAPAGGGFRVVRIERAAPSRGSGGSGAHISDGRSVAGDGLTLTPPPVGGLGAGIAVPGQAAGPPALPGPPASGLGVDDLRDREGERETKSEHDNERPGLLSRAERRL